MTIILCGLDGLTIILCGLDGWDIILSGLDGLTIILSGLDGRLSIILSGQDGFTIVLSGLAGQTIILSVLGWVGHYPFWAGSSVGDPPYNFDMDPDLDPGCEKYDMNLDMDPDRTLIRIQIQAKKDSVPGKSRKFDKKRSHSMFFVFILLNNQFSINNHLN